MKLLTLKSESHYSAGVLIEKEVLDFTAVCEVLEAKGEWVEGEPQLDSFRKLEGTYRDALDLLVCEPAWVARTISRVGADSILLRECREKGALIPVSDAVLGPPVLSPGKILAVGLNYAAHARETNAKLPESPLIFSKCATALIGPLQQIRLPKISDKIDYEGELAVIIGKQATSVKADSAYDYVAGYAIMNDVTARDIQRRESQWVRAKGLDTFAPCGPWLVTRDEIPDPNNLDIELRVNGELRQKSNTSDLIFKVSQLIEFISQDLTLKPGDIITTGTPSGVGFTMTPPIFLKPGDLIEITIERIGTLVNSVVGPEA
jgi:2-keto-4-pentenoate hydratase/2-oxohepta-3-ene-1,7-dioic acid hydratase in catechol pathway